MVRELRTHDRLCVEVAGLAIVVSAADASPVSAPRRRRPPATEPTEIAPPPSAATREVDLHRLTVSEALVRVEETLNRAALEDVATVRFVHGRGSGRLRTALHHRLAGIACVRTYRIDPRNEGVTIVTL